jgi:hypothetical protein
MLIHVPSHPRAGPIQNLIIWMRMAYSSSTIIGATCISLEGLIQPAQQLRNRMSPNAQFTRS